MIHVAVHALGLAAAGAAVWLPGRLAAGLLGDLGRFRHLASFCLGLAYWTCALFALAAAGLLDGWGLALAAAPPALLALRWRRIFRRPEPAWPGAAELAFGVLLAAVLGLTFCLAVSPTVSWDADVYHLTLPRLYLEHGGFRPVPMSVYSDWPLGTELLYAAAMIAGDYMLAKAFHFGFGLLVLYALWTTVAAERSRAVAGLAAALFLANEVVSFQLQRAYVDLAYAFFFLCGFVFLHRALEEDDDGGDGGPFLLLSGIACGLAAGAKVSGIVAAGVLGVAWLPRLARAARRGRLGAALRPFLARFALPAVLLWIPWLAKAAVYTGNPVYPFLYRWLGGPDWSVELGARFHAWQASIGMGRGALDYLLLPVRVILSGGRGYDLFDGALAPWWIVLLPLAVVLGRREALVRRALAVAGLFFAFWAVSSQQMRFLIPALPLAAIAGACGVGKLFELLPRTSWRRGAGAAGAAAFLVTAYAGTASAGWRTLIAFHRLQGDLAATVVPERHRFINENLPAGAKLVFLNTNLGFFCRREYLADSFFEASQIADWLGGAASADEVRRRLAERGVTHLLLDRRPRVPDFPRPLVELVNDPASVKVVFRSSDDRFVVFRLLAPG